MKLACRCGCTLTNDLYPSKKWKVTTHKEVVESSDGSIYDYINHEFEVRPGSFLLSNQQWSEKAKRIYPESVFVSGEDILDKSQVAYRRGQGCCGNAWTKFMCPECGVKVGEMNLDCYQEKRVELYVNRVQRKYR